MSIFLVAIAGILVASPLLTQSHFRMIYDLERRQIAVDNAAIVLGRGDRDLLNKLAKANEEVRRLEMEHHLLHACARSGTPAAVQCEAGDRLFEQAMIGIHRRAKVRADLEWIASHRRSVSEARRLKTQPISIARSSDVPVHDESCPICRLGIFWELDAEAMPLRAQIEHSETGKPTVNVSLRMNGKSLRQENFWNYRLETP